MTISVVITNLPANGGSAITGIDYRINGGAAVSVGAAVPGTYATTAVLGDNVEVRAVNAIGPGPWSAAKNIPALGFFPTLATQAFADNSGNQTYVFPAATGAGLTFTYALTSPPSGVTINGATRTITFDTNAMAPQSGTVITVTATDNLGRAATGSPRTFALTIGVGAVNPVLDALTFADPGNATPDTLTAPFSYAGTDTLRAFVAIRNGGTALTAAQLAAGTGTFLERVVINPFSLANFDLTGFTATSNTGTAIDMAIGEVNNGGISDARTVAVSGLDFTAPTLSSAVPADGATGVAVGSNIALTFSENIFAGSGLFRLRNTTANTQIETFNPATGTGSSGGSISIAGAAVTINPFADLLNATDYAVRWDASALLDADGNALAANTGDTLYNFTTAVSAVTYTLGATPAYLDLVGNGATILTVSSSGSDRTLIVEFLYEINDPDSLTFNGTVYSTPHLTMNFSFSQVRVYLINVPAGVSGAVTLQRAGAGDVNAARMRYGFVPATATVQAAVASGSNTNNATLDASQAVAAGSVLLVGAIWHDNDNGGARVLNATGFTADKALGLNRFAYWAMLRKDISSTGTETVTATNSGESGSNGKSLYTIEVTP